MKRVYIDWGVISNLKKPEFSDVRDFLLSHKRDLFFVYSPEHFDDALKSTGDERLLQDIQTLESLADNHLLMYKDKAVRPYQATPSEYYRDNKDSNITIDYSNLLSSISQDDPIVGSVIKSLLTMPFPIPVEARSMEFLKVIFPDIPENPSFKDVIQSGASFVGKMMYDNEFYKSYRSSIQTTGLKLEANSGNWSAKEVIPNISDRLKELGVKMDFEELVKLGFKDKKIDRFTYFIAAYSMLDLIGYKSDKLPKVNNAMNSINTDAQHAFFAAYCDYFITQDSRLACKAQALYKQFGISTKVISPRDVINEFVEERKDNLSEFLREQLKEENIESRAEKCVVYKFIRRFLGVFSHCLVSEQDNGLWLEMKLAFDNYSNFVFYEEAGIMVDVISDYLGIPSKDSYSVTWKKIIMGDSDAAISWDYDGLIILLMANPDTKRPELYIKLSLES